ncbi:MAG: hypothetical protein ACE15B_20005 [Bryobacteraceae bacterium]
MKRFALLALACLPLAAADVLVVADEFPAMEVLARALQSGAGLSTAIVKQPEMPKDFAPFRAVVVYVHRNLDEAVEKASIAYARAGGKLVLLHHTISSGKRKNREWFPFLGVELPARDFAQGGYKWLDPVDWEMVNLAPGHPITTGGVKYPGATEYRGETRPSIAFSHSEVYLNHALSGPRTVLMGLKYRDPNTGTVYMQDTGGWTMRADKGTVTYLMAGHSTAEFEIPAYARIVVNAIR